jgi:hypothetical protein
MQSKRSRKKKLVVAHNKLRGSSGVSICTFLLVRVRENAVEALEEEKIVVANYHQLVAQIF